jgi:hypothetical protein
MTTERLETDDQCSYCERRFKRARYLELHLGLCHEESLTDAEAEAFREARETERQELRLFRLKALVILVLLYFGLLMAFAAFA